MARHRGTLVPLGEFGPLDPLSDVAHQHYVDGFAGAAVEAARAFQVLARACGDLTTLRYLLYTESVALQEVGRHEEAVAVARELLSQVGEDEPVWRAKALAMIAEASTREGQAARAMGALSDAAWTVRTIAPGSYGHLSASMAVALAMRSMLLFEDADERLRTLAVHQTRPWLQLMCVHEMVELSSTWGAALGLVGQEAGSRAQFVAAAERALLVQRRGLELDDVPMRSRGEVFEAYAMLQLGATDLAAARAEAAAAGFTHRPELLETQLLRLVRAAHATAHGRWDDAVDHLETAIADALSTRQDVWLVMALEALADVDVARAGERPAIGIWKAVARGALERLWAEREGRFAALQDRDHVRRLTAEADRMGRVVLQDPLTGLGNRRLLVATLEAAARPASVVFVDVDLFKEVNDRHGHGVGDDVLRRVAQILRAQCRAEDVVVRFGGDEFVVLTTGGRARAERVACRVHRAIREADWRDLAPDLRVTVSVGVGHPDGDPTTPLGAADAALLAAKRAGRDRVGYASPPVDAQAC